MSYMQKPFTNNTMLTIATTQSTINCTYPRHRLMAMQCHSHIGHHTSNLKIKLTHCFLRWGFSRFLTGFGCFSFTYLLLTRVLCSGLHMWTWVCKQCGTAWNTNTQVKHYPSEIILKITKTKLTVNFPLETFLAFSSTLSTTLPPAFCWLASNLEPFSVVACTCRTW